MRFDPPALGIGVEECRDPNCRYRLWRCQNPNCPGSDEPKWVREYRDYTAWWVAPEFEGRLTCQYCGGELGPDE